MWQMGSIWWFSPVELDFKRARKLEVGKIDQIHELETDESKTSYAPEDQRKNTPLEVPKTEQVGHRILLQSSHISDVQGVYFSLSSARQTLFNFASARRVILLARRVFCGTMHSL